jgi:predicted aminopeptidase
MAKTPLEAQIEQIHRLAEEKVRALHAEDARWEARRLRQAKERAVVEEMRSRLEKEYGLTEHPKRELLWDKAWDRGHSAGYDEVELVYGDLAELLVP